MKTVPYDGAQATQYYVNHYLGTQQGGYLPYFEGNLQTGDGLWGSIFRTVLPLLKSGAKAVLPHAVSFGKNIVKDVVVHGKPVKSSFRKRGLEELKQTGRTLGQRLAKRGKSDIFS